MAMNLSLSTSVVSRNETARTSTISVAVTLSYSFSGTISFNRYTDDRGPTLSLSVGDWSGTFKVPFNSSELSSGTETLYSSNFTISHGSATGSVSVPIYASYDTKTTATVSPVSKTVILDGMGSSGGGDSGGDDGDDGGDNTGGNTGGDGITAPPGNATIVGQLELVSLLADMWATERNYTTGSADIIEADISRNVVAIKFTTPKFDGVSSSIDLAVVTGSVDSGIPPTNVSICTDDASFAEYLKRSDSVSDPNQIASGTIQLTANSICSTNIPTTQLESETTYYVFLWPGTFGNGLVMHSATILESTRNSINVNYTSSGSGVTPVTRAVFYISNGSSFDEYQAYIDNGTTWDKYEAYIDNGTSWDLYG